ncbi:hypothetical protein ACJDU8_19600 [Clostridium sp. WILCCON 0269]|uniref:Hemolysin XhlA n=1 Tax=Candidatus Clostridium eludens TaxID=3381663 RepID=A0ABW8SRF2_9CLOT
MSENYDAKLWEEKHKNINERIASLCKQLESLVNTLKWGFGVLVASFMTFFLYLLESRLK